MNTVHTQRVLFSLLGLLPLASASAEGFIDDSKLKLQLRNVYFNENFRDEHGLSARSARTAKSERTEWAQGFLLDYQSGFTQAPLGLGWMPWACSGSSSTPDVAAAVQACCRFTLTGVRPTSSPAWA